MADLDDERLARIALSRLSAEPDLSPHAIFARCHGGVLVLDGEVPSWTEVVHAGHVAGAIGTEVKGVVNHLQAKNKQVRRAVGAARPHADPARDWNLSPRAVGDWSDEADVVVIGAGIIGAAVARELSRYDLRIALLEKEADVASGASRANNGMIHPGIDPEPGTLKATLNVKGNALWDEITADLDVPLERCGLLAVIVDEDQDFFLDLVDARAAQNGVPGVRVIRDRDELRRLAPSLSEKVIGALWVPTMAITSPYLATIACAENAVQNGVRLHLATTVTGLDVADGRVTEVRTTRGRIRTKLVINAAGVHADDIAALAGAEEFTIHPRKGELFVFDKDAARSVGPVVAILRVGEDAHTKGGGVARTVDGNVIWGPTAEEVPDKEDCATSEVGRDRVFGKFGGLIPGFPEGSLIAYFAGLRAATYTEDFHIAPALSVRGLLNVAGIQSPGLAAAPAIAAMAADHVRTMADDAGIALAPRSGFQPRRQAMPRFAELDQAAKARLVAADPAWGRIVCRCEEVAEAEIVAALRRPVPALTLDALKRRARTGMGRCQGGFCGVRVAAIMAREFGIPIASVTKDGPGSELFAGEVASS